MKVSHSPATLFAAFDDPAEQTALTERFAVCPDQPITVTFAR